MKIAPSRSTVEDAASFLLEKAGKQGAAGADVLYSFNSGNALSLRDGVPEREEAGISFGIGLRTLDASGRQGVAHVNSLDRDILEDLVSWSLNNCRDAEEDPHVLLREEPLSQIPDLAMTDPEILKITREDRIASCRSMWETARSADGRVVSVRSASWGDGAEDVFYACSTGISGWYGGASAGCGVSVILQNGDSMEMGGFGEESRFLSSLSPAGTALEAVRRTALILGGTTLPSGRYDLVLDGETAASLVDVIGELFLASSIHKNKSFLRGKKGEKVASSSLSMVDDGILRGGIASAPFDGEGVPCSTTCLLQDGVVKSWLYNLKYARIDGEKSTGNASRSLSGIPDVDCTNLCLVPGKWTEEDLLLQVGRGLYVTELLGLHTVNAVSGEFSVGVKGAAIEGGVLGKAVSGMTIAGNLKDFLNNVDLVGNNFKFYGSTGACSLVVRDVAAAGC